MTQDTKDPNWHPQTIMVGDIMGTQNPYCAYLVTKVEHWTDRTDQKQGLTLRVVEWDAAKQMWYIDPTCPEEYFYGWKGARYSHESRSQGQLDGHYHYCFLLHRDVD